MIYTTVSLITIVFNSIGWVYLAIKGDRIITRWFLFPLAGAIIWTTGWLFLSDISVYYSGPVPDLVQNFLVKFMFTGAMSLPIGLLITLLFYPNRNSWLRLRKY